MDSRCAAEFLFALPPGDAWAAESLQQLFEKVAPVYGPARSRQKWLVWIVVPPFAARQRMTVDDPDKQASGSESLLAAIGRIARGAIATRSSLRSHIPIGTI